MAHVQEVCTEQVVARGEDGGLLQSYIRNPESYVCLYTVSSGFRVYLRA